ncbi:unnamed protein product [Rhizophagus irregularis]|nr:unnamed protein product [Rhizophagus irregularis]
MFVKPHAFNFHEKSFQTLMSSTGEFISVGVNNSIQNQLEETNNLANSPDCNDDDPDGIFTSSVNERLTERLLNDLFIGLPDPNCLMGWFKNTCFVLKALYTIPPILGGSGDLQAMHLIMMTKFILETRPPSIARTSGFVGFYNSQPESRDYPLGNITYHYINCIFCHLIDIGIEKEQLEQDVVFENLVHLAFPQGRNILYKRGKNMKLHSVNRNIDISAVKMKKLHLDFETAYGINGHLELKEGNKVSIYNFNGNTYYLMHRYHLNRLALLYGIETAGIEVLKTFTSLLIDRESQDIMIEYDLWKTASHLRRRVLVLNHGDTRDISYTLLADKFVKFDRKINSFWFRFQQETGNRRLYQPVEYYFIAFSIFLGILTVVQTITGIASLILQVKLS